jgi:hypothetical protein
MTWLAWRQFRLSGAAVYVLLVAFAAAFALVSLPDLTGATLVETLSVGGSAATLYGVGVLAMLALPAIIGVFWGAPLVARELENGTHRLVWTQSISRTRWLATKVGVVGLAALAGTAAVTALVTWWCGPIDDALNAGARSGSGFLEQVRMQPVIFAARGIVPIGYTAFAFALGVAAGAVIRRTVPAMALTLVVFIAFGIAAPKLRAQLGATERTTAITAENMRGLGVSGITPSGAPRGPVEFVTVAIDSPGAWEIANETVRAGVVQDELPLWVVGCVPQREFGPPGVKSDPGCFDRLAREGYQQRVAYMPASRYWTLQAIEATGFLVLAGLLLGGCFWWVRHRVS